MNEVADSLTHRTLAVSAPNQTRVAQCLLQRGSIFFVMDKEILTSVWIVFSLFLDSLMPIILLHQSSCNSSALQVMI
jgi:hypothetical protein